MGIKRKLAYAVAAVGIAVFMGSCGCSPDGQKTGDPLVDYSDDSQGVAATVNGATIGEKSVTAYIENFRSQQGLESDEDWGRWMFENGYGPEDVRSDTVDYYINREILHQAADELNVKADETALQRRMELLRAERGSDEEWREYLNGMSTTEEQLRMTIEAQLLQEAMRDAAVPDAHATDAEVLKTAKEYVGDSGAKRSSFILLAVGDEDKAKEVRGKIARGELEFEDAAAQYSVDTTTAENGGDAGWSCFQTFIDPYSETLEKMEEGEVSELVSTDSGIFIIKCTEEVGPAKEIESLSALPKSLVEEVRGQLDETAKQAAFAQWLDERKSSADIVRNPMPDGLSYDVDMTKYREDAEVQIASSASGEAGSSKNGDAQGSDEAEGPESQPSASSSSEER